MTDWRRFHRAAVLFETLRALKDGALPIAVLVAAGALGGGLDTGDLLRAVGYLVIGGAIATAVGLVRWQTTRWRVTDTDVQRREGVLNKRERRVPLARVQSLDAVRGPLQRAAGVATLHVQTGGGGRDGEIVLTAITPAEAARLHALVGREPLQDEAAPAAPRPPERRLGMRGLLLAGLTAGQAGAALAVAATVAQLAGDLFDPQDGRRDLDALQRLAPDSALGWLGLAAAALAVFWAIAIGGSVVAFAGFTLRREGDRLRIRRGLVSQRESAIPVRRVQAVRVVEGVLRQPFGLAALRVETLGYGGEPAANQTLFPIIARREIPALLAEFLPEHATDLDGIVRPPVRALRRYVLEPALAVAVPAAVVALAVPGAGAWPLLAVLPAALLGAAQWSAAGWRLSADGRAVLRRRVVARSTLLFAPARVQRAAVAQSVLQRRAALADVEVSVGPASGRVRHLEEATAWRLWRAARPVPAPPGPA
jgi:putative membrane protein